jgi:hypothetical protein
VLSSEIVVPFQVNQLRLSCANGGECIISGNGNTRLLNFQGSNQKIYITGITFQKGNAQNGSGGAILMSGNVDADIRNNKFYHNQASLYGGAVSVPRGEFVGNMYATNSAAQCFNSFRSNTRQCVLT